MFKNLIYKIYFLKKFYYTAIMLIIFLIITIIFRVFSCAVGKHFSNRFQRFKNFERYLEKYPEWRKQVSFHVFEGIGHKEDLCYPDPALLDFVFE